METINGRILPDDSGQPDRKNHSTDESFNADPPESTPGSRRARMKRSTGSGNQSENLSRSRKAREADLPDAECTIGSAKPQITDEPANRRACRSSGESTSDRYVELGELGRGGWGVVQRALDRQLQREVAVKRISSPGKIRSVEREQFLHEARITSGLQHPGVVPVHELVADEGGDTYYVMKLLEGDTLRHHIRLAHAHAPSEGWSRHELLESITPLLLRFIDVCNAVAYAHRCGIIHRDLKPTNVMAGGFGETIVVDWGLARYVDDKGDETTLQGPAKQSEQSGSHRSSLPMESEGSVIGTPTYMAPEQARGELASLGSHSDIYSLGVILYEIVAANHPHKGMKIKTVLRRAREGVFTPLCETQPCVPKALEKNRPYCDGTGS